MTYSSLAETDKTRTELKGYLFTHSSVWFNCELWEGTIDHDYLVENLSGAVAGGALIVGCQKIIFVSKNAKFRKFMGTIVGKLKLHAPHTFLTHDAAEKFQRLIKF